MKFEYYLNEKYRKHQKMKNGVFVEILGDIEMKTMQQIVKEVVEGMKKTLAPRNLTPTQIKLEVGRTA